MLNRINRRDELGILLNDLSLTSSGCEVGVFEADYAVTILTTWRGQLLYLVDPWRYLPDYLDSWNASDSEMQRRYELSLARLGPFTGRYKILRETSHRAAAIIPDASLDFVYIDANHGYQHVSRDIHMWYPKVRVGGLIAGHDYYDALADEAFEPCRGTNGPKEKLTSYGVKAAVDEFSAVSRVDIRVTDEHYPTWYGQKPPDWR